MMHDFQITLPMVKDIRDDFERLYLRYEDADDHSDEPPMLELTGVSFLANEAYILGEPDLDYIVRETNWYDSQSLNVHDIPGGAPKIWRDVADTHGNINSNYGHLVYSSRNGDQFGNVVNELTRNPKSRRAVMIYTRPSMHTDSQIDGREDFVCTNTVQYFIRGGKLHAVVQMRSNDAVFGYRNDYAWQRIVQNRLLAELRKSHSQLKLGSMIWQVGSLHIYPRHIPLLEEAIATSDWRQSTK